MTSHSPYAAESPPHIADLMVLSCILLPLTNVVTVVRLQSGIGFHQIFIVVEFNVVDEAYIKESSPQRLRRARSILPEGRSSKDFLPSENTLNVSSGCISA